MSRYVDVELVKHEMQKLFLGLADRFEMKVVLDNIPTADVKETVRGEWIWDDFL